LLPLGRANAGVDSPVGDDLHVAIGQQQIDQDTAVLFGVPDAELRKDLDRALSRRLTAEQRPPIERGLDGEPDFSAVRPLGSPDRLLDRRERIL
jgi:hypothetical protein